MKKLNNLKSTAQIVEIPIRAQAEFDALSQNFQRQQREDLLTHLSKTEKNNKLLRQEIEKANDQIKALQLDVKGSSKDQPTKLDEQFKDLLELQLRQAHEELREQFSVNRKLQAELAQRSKIEAKESTWSQPSPERIEQAIVNGDKIYSALCSGSTNVAGKAHLTLKQAGKSAELSYFEPGESIGVVVSSDGRINKKSHLLSLRVINCFQSLLATASQKLIDSDDQHGGEFFSQELKSLTSVIAERKKGPFIGEISIKHKNKIPGYQCIWFEVREIATANATIKNFNFRLAIAAVNEQGESIHPRLEFPEPMAGWASLKSWYPESEDGYGAKLELRFETNGGHLDINVWDRLDAEDKSIISVLLESIYHHLSEINEEWTSGFWSAAKWCDAVQSMIEILKSRRSVKFWTM